MRKLAVAVGIVLSMLIGGAFGYAIASKPTSVNESSILLSCFMDELAALSYLDRGQVEDAHRALRMAIEGNIVALAQFPSTPVDEQNPQARRKLLTQYQAIRAKHPVIEYPDDGTMKRKVEEAFAVKQ